jgi:hypothetical protein
LERIASLDETHAFDLSRPVWKMFVLDVCLICFGAATGWAFEKLIHGGEFLEEVTHLVLDEVHERSIDADLLHLLLKVCPRQISFVIVGFRLIIFVASWFFRPCLQTKDREWC